MRKCKKGWHLDDARGYQGICSRCILNINHPTLRRINELLRTARLEHRNRTLPNMPKRNSVLPMRQRQIADYKQAAALLKDDLVWSGDFESIRYDLLLLIEQHIRDEDFPEHLSEIVQKLISEENDLSI